MRGLRRTFILGCLVCGLATATSAQAATGVAVSVSSSANPSIVGQQVTLTVTVVTQPRGQILPAGTVYLFVDPNSSTSPDRVSTAIPFSENGDTGSGSYTMPFRGLGTHEVFADW